MSVCWGSETDDHVRPGDFLRSARARSETFVPRRPRPAGMTRMELLRRAGSALLLSFGLLAVLGPRDAAARRERSHGWDSARVVRRITVSDDGIKIVHSDREVRVDTHRHVTGQASAEAGSGSVEIDADTLGFDKEAGVESPGMTLNVDQSGVVRMFSDAEVPAGERVEGDVVAIFGDVMIEGEVSGNAVAVFGSVRLSPGARVNGDAVAVGGLLDQPAGANVGGESVSIGFLPISWGVPALGVVLGAVFVGWLASLFLGWILILLFPTRMLRIAATASQRTGGSLVLGLLSGPLLIIAIVLLLVTVIGIPLAFVLPVAYLLAVWAGQLALTYALGCRLMRRRLGEGSLLAPLLAGTVFVAAFFVLGTMLGHSQGILRTVALFFHVLGCLLIMGLSVIGIGAFLLSRMGARPRDLEYRESAASAYGGATAPTSGGQEAPPAPLAPPAPGA